jgi:hypothetical protein
MNKLSGPMKRGGDFWLAELILTSEKLCSMELNYFGYFWVYRSYFNLFALTEINAFFQSKLHRQVN